MDITALSPRTRRGAQIRHREHHGISLQYRAGYAFLLAGVLAAALYGTARAADSEILPSSQQQYQFVRSADQGPFTLQRVQAPVKAPGAHEVLVKVHATSLNRRDVFMLQGQYPVGPVHKVVPLSDGAGEVVAVGTGVTRFHSGDRVAGIFFPEWISGRATGKAMQSSLGGNVDGMLSQYVVLDERSLVTIPVSLSYEEAATLPCAGVTAWNALFTRGHLQRGDYVLLEGTGGVSLLGLVLAKAADARPIITSSSDAKLARAKALGAVGGINYKTTPEWQQPVRELTGGAGVEQVLEVGGKDTLAHALASLGTGGHVALIGGLSGFGGELPVMSLLGSGLTASGIYVGSRADFEALNAFIDKHHVKPVVDRVFDYDAVPAAFDAMEKGEFFGKIVIRVAP